MSTHRWPSVASKLRDRARQRDGRLNRGQRDSLLAIADRLELRAGNAFRGVVLADEVGMGKTRVACAVARATVDSGGRVAICVPPGLGAQWGTELAGEGVEAPELLRSLGGFLGSFDGSAQPTWRQSNVVVISHLLSNWRLGDKTHDWRLALLASLVAEYRKDQQLEYPKGYRKRGWMDWSTGRAAREILDAKDGRKKVRTWLDSLPFVSWERTYFDGAAYGRWGWLRPHLEQAVGWGLGRFDLVILDEAHKARAEASGLSRVLDGVLQLRKKHAKLALTATPVTLDVGEWANTLSRVGAGPDLRAAVQEVARRFQAAAEDISDAWRESPDSRSEWTAAAAAFEDTLRPYVLRRDKTTDPAVQRFAEQTGDVHGYRRPRTLALRPQDLPIPWQRVVVASEALSTAAHGADELALKRLRLTLANGHGLSALVDEQAEAAAEPPDPSAPPREQRLAQWRAVVAHGLADGGADSLFDHPQILKAAEFVEGRVGAGHKVLVFGRFTRPMHALTRLVNARARVRAVLARNGPIWPEEMLLRDGALKPGDRAAARQLGVGERRLVNAMVRHPARYRKDETRRKWLRKRIFGLCRLGRADAGSPAWLEPLMSAAEDDEQAALVTRACWELLPEAQRRAVHDRRVNQTLRREVARACTEFAAAGLAPEDDADLDDEAAVRGWARLRTHLESEFTSQRGGLARTLDGRTRTPTRRLLQAAFNRKGSWPKVLVAQSTVGREGLNLHEACRVVLLFHPEWNPAVVEQQIGRVDRINSRWERDLAAAIDADVAAEDLPRIEVHCLVFEGTYDEQQWAVLTRRWKALRAQLHGVVITPEEIGEDPESQSLAAKINALAPRFPPRPETR